MWVSWNLGLRWEMGVLMSSTMNSLESICERCLPSMRAERIALVAMYFSVAIVLFDFVISVEFACV